MNGFRCLLATVLMYLASGANAADPGTHKLVGVWYGTHLESSVASTPLHWKLWRQTGGRFVIDYYVQAGCYLSYSHRELGRWDLRRGVYRVITEQVGERKLDAQSKDFVQRYRIAQVSSERMRLSQQDVGVDLLLTRIPADFRMDTMNLCPADAADS